MARKKSRLVEEGEPTNGTPSLATGSDPAPEAGPPPLPETPPPLPDPAPPVEPEAQEPPPSELPPDEPRLGEPTPPPDAPAFPTTADDAPPVAQVAQVAQVFAPDPALDERLRRLESMLSQVQNLQSLEQRVAERVASQIQQAPVAIPATLSSPPPPAASATSSVLGQARAWLSVGKHLLPALPAGSAPARPRGWLIWEMIAELRAIACMYLDPRYRVAWYTYVIPPALLLAFMTTKWWFPFGLALKELGMLWLLTPVDLLLLYCMFKILGHEARRYRETAPDLPPSLRL